MYDIILGNLDRQARALKLLSSLLEEEFSLLVSRDTNAIMAQEFSIHELLRQLVDSDVQRYQIEVHGLKSASANIGAMDLSAMARAQENAAAKGDSAFIAREFPALLKAYESLLQNIGSFLEQRRRKDDTEAAKLPALTAQELKEQVGTALDQLEHFRSRECAGSVEEILRHELPEDMKERLLQIQEQLKLYEDDNAEELLRQLLAIF